MAELTSQNNSENQENLPKVLLVEDDLPTIWITKIFLKDICSIDSASSGLEAIEAVKKNNYKIVLMDINLGLGIDGMETLKKIREIDGYEKIPVAAYTVHTVFDDKNYFLKAGFDYYISKPFSKIDFQNKISEILS
jgi:CheY-like chemotaxis protein